MSFVRHSRRPELGLLWRGTLLGAVGILTTALVLCAACGSRREPFGPTEDASSEGPVVVFDGSPGGACDDAKASRSPLGCEYEIAPFYSSHTNVYCTAVLVSNPNEKPVRLTLERGSTSFDIGPSSRLLTGVGTDPGWNPLTDASLPPGASAVVALVDGEPDIYGRGRCPFAALADRSAFLLREATGSAFHLSATAPIYAVYYYAYGVPQGGWMTGTTALRATSAWGTEHIDVGILAPGRPENQVYEGNDYKLQNAKAFTMVLASEPTDVTLLGKNGVLSQTLQAGEAHRFERDDLFIGSAITSSKSIAVVVGAQTPFIPYNVPADDTIVNQIPSLDSWRSEYASVGFPSRKSGSSDPPIYRIIAAKAGTRFQYDPVPAPDAPTELGAGGLATFRSAAPFVVKSQDDQHPFYVSIAMTGSGPLCDKLSEDGGVPTSPDDVSYWNCPGDPELVNVVPSSEYAKTFSFVTGHDFADTYLVLVRKQSETGGFGEVNLDCAGVVEGWKPIGVGSAYETVTLPLSQGNFDPQEYPGGSCQLGAHRMSSSMPFTGYLWAWSHYVEARADCNVPHCDDGGARSYGFALYGLNNSSEVPK